MGLGSLLESARSRARRFRNRQNDTSTTSSTSGSTILLTRDDFASSTPENLTSGSVNEDGWTIFTMSKGEDSKVYLRGTPVGLALAPPWNLATAAQVNVASGPEGYGYLTPLPGVTIPASIQSISDLLSDPSDLRPSVSKHSSICGDSIVINQAGGPLALTFTRDSDAFAKWLITQSQLEIRLLDLVRQTEPVLSIHDILESDPFNEMKDHQDSFPLDLEETRQVGSLWKEFGQDYAYSDILIEGQCVAHRLMSDWYSAEGGDPDDVDYKYGGTETHRIAMTSVVAMLVERGQDRKLAPIKREGLKGLLRGYIKMGRLSMRGYPRKMDPKYGLTLPARGTV